MPLSSIKVLYNEGPGNTTNPYKHWQVKNMDNSIMGTAVRQSVKTMGDDGDGIMQQS